VPLARFKDLCVDAADPVAVGVFWARVLGQAVEALDDGDAHVSGPWFHPLWLNRVPEAKVRKNRVHLDVEVTDLGVLEALGAVVVRHDQPDWAVLVDPEGNELCVSIEPAGRPAGEAPDGPPARAFALCVDSARPVETAAWWRSVVGGQVVPGPDGQPRWLVGGAGLEDLTWKFVPVPEPKAAKNRVHWDVTTPDVAALVAAGATVLRRPDSEVRWTVLADPEGNEFCAFEDQPTTS
jgi:hypothetical protein